MGSIWNGDDGFSPEYMVPAGEDVNHWLRKAAEEGEFDRGDLVVETGPVGDLGEWGPSGVPIAENPAGFGYQGVTVRMPVEDHRRLQTYIGTNEGIAKGQFGNPPPDPEQFWQTSPERVEPLVEVLRGEVEPMEPFDGAPMPYVEMGWDGYLLFTQEGRHRTVAAETVGLDTIPVRIIRNDEREGVKHDEWAED